MNKSKEENMKDFQILIVEDDPAVSILTRDLLLKVGYKVMAVFEGKD